MISPAAGHPETSVARVILADEHPIIRCGLRHILDTHPRFTVVAETSLASEAINFCQNGGCELLVLDPSLRSTGSLELIRHVSALPNSPRILAFSALDERIWAERCLRAGAHGYLMKDAGSEQILRTLLALLRGERWLSITLMGSLVERATGTSPAHSGSVSCLSDRELEVFHCIGGGATTRVIADNLHVSVKTVEAHKANIKRKLGAGDAGELARLAMEWVAR